MRTLIVDDHATFADAMRWLLAGCGEALEDCVSCTSGERALDLASADPFDMVLLDWNLGAGLSGVPLIKALKARLPATPVVVVSAESTPYTIRAAIDAGASGFVPKEAPSELLTDAMQLARHGGVYLPVAALQAAALPIAPPPADTAAALPRSICEAFPGLTPRHADVLSLVVRGLSNKEVARELGISDGTVKQHLSTIYRELGVDNRTKAVMLLAQRRVPGVLNHRPSA